MSWPSIPDGDDSKRTEFEKILYEGKVGDAAAQLRDKASAEGRSVSEEWELRRYGWELDKAEKAAEYALQKSIHDARVAIATASIDRGYKAAEFVRNVASAIATVYTGIAGLSFAVKNGVRLPARGIVPALFLGLALVLSTAYVAWLGRAPATHAPTPHSAFQKYQARRLNAFIDWTAAIALQRAYVLRSSVIALGAAVLFLPIAFIILPGWFIWAAPIVAAALTLALPWIIDRVLRRRKNRESGRKWQPDDAWVTSARA